MTDVVPRAYDIADAYRRKAVKVVMGGIHPTVLPDEALEHADAVVVGEAEGIWPRLLSDAAAGQMQRLYRAGKMTELQGLPKPRRISSPEPTVKVIFRSRSASRHPGDVRMIANSVPLAGHWGITIGSGRFRR